jgi:Gas vesicle synthesis protein GvpL/GvpF
MLYVYALVDARPMPPAPEGEGHGGAPLHVVERGSIAAVCSRHDRIELPMEADHLWRHEHVAERLMDEHAVLPVRFGTTVADEDALATMLDDREDEFRGALERVRGRVELGVRVLWAPPEPEPEAPSDGAGPGTAYLLGRLAARNAASSLAESIHAGLAVRAADARHEVSTTPRLLLSAAYLVGRDDVGSFLEAVDEAARRHPEVELLCTGPWPAHTFARPVGELR